MNCAAMSNQPGLSSHYSAAGNLPQYSPRTKPTPCVATQENYFMDCDVYENTKNVYEVL